MVYQNTLFYNFWYYEITSEPLNKLSIRDSDNALRVLATILIDFSSNDYLALQTPRNISCHASILLASNCIQMEPQVLALLLGIINIP
jgi:7-keto-8-aminopelargonate synthetase-like enzyme